MTLHTAITAQVDHDQIIRRAVYAAQLERARRNLTLDECRAIIGDEPIRPALSWETLSPEAMTDALFAIAGGRVTKVGQGL
jgi:hypothetical protein